MKWRISKNKGNLMRLSLFLASMNLFLPTDYISISWSLYPSFISSIGKSYSSVYLWPWLHHTFRYGVKLYHLINKIVQKTPHGLGYSEWKMIKCPIQAIMYLVFFNHCWNILFLIISPVFMVSRVSIANHGPWYLSLYSKDI